ncbi:MAG: hypothetical protein JO345_04095 [Streptosporangiaceae bacterium]|nr:hypothetical protein [Streptosporangiaceae bacterium]
MYLTEELASERIRSHLEHAKQIRSARKYRALSRARRTEQKAERRLIEAWRARAALESKLHMY